MADRHLVLSDKCGGVRPVPVRVLLGRRLHRSRARSVHATHATRARTVAAVVKRGERGRLPFLRLGDGLAL